MICNQFPAINGPFSPISVSSSDFNPRNTSCITTVKIIAYLEIEQKLLIYGLEKCLNAHLLKMN